jgi:hypothetical protein
MNPNGARPEPPDTRVFSQNRAKFPPSDLIPYCGKSIAWTPDGTRIVASGPDFSTLWDQLQNAGADPGQLVFEDVPPLEEDTWL